MAFTLSRTVGQKLAERVIAEEVNDSGQANEMSNKLGGIQAAIEQGSFRQQSIAVALLRLTPVVPFSASNYLLGMTPLPYPAFFTGTIAGMAVWSCVYASLGSASRSLLKSGVGLDVLLAEVQEQAGKYTEEAAVAGLALGVLAGLYWAFNREKSDQQTEVSVQEQTQEPALPPVFTPVRRLVARIKGHANV
jgi:uncharacterized membrane protein YdjX (TVP38/TMEM64 family)